MMGRQGKGEGWDKILLPIREIEKDGKGQDRKQESASSEVGAQMVITG